MNPRPDELERLLSELADGAVADDSHAAARDAVRSDPRAADTARHYARLADLLRNWRALPQGAAPPSLVIGVRRALDAEVSIAASQAAAGELPAEEVRVLDRLAARDPRAAESLAAFGRVQRALDAWAGPQPAVDWNDLSRRIRSAVRRDAAAARRTRRVRAVAGLAVAAVVLLAVGVLWRGGSGVAPSPHVEPRPPVMVQIDAPSAAGKVVARFDPAPPPGEPVLEPTGPTPGLGMATVPPRQVTADDFDD